MSASRITFPSKRSTTTYFIIFDFISQLAAGEVANSQAVVASVYSGVDASPGALISGVATFSGTMVSQKVTGGVDGVIYELVCTIVTNFGQTLQLAGYLAVMPEVA